MNSTLRRSTPDQNFGRWRPKIALWRFGLRSIIESCSEIRNTYAQSSSLACSSRKYRKNIRFIYIRLYHGSWLYAMHVQFYIKKFAYL